MQKPARCGLSQVHMKLTIPFSLIAPAALSALTPSPARAAFLLPIPPLAQIPQGLKDSFGFGLGILFLVGFIWGVINIWGGADKMKRGDADGKMGIVSGIIIAGAATIMGALFAIFGLADGVLTPKF